MWGKIANPEKRSKTPPKELFKEAVHKISWSYGHWLSCKVENSVALEPEPSASASPEVEDEILRRKWLF